MAGKEECVEDVRLRMCLEARGEVERRDEIRARAKLGRNEATAEADEERQPIAHDSTHIHSFWYLSLDTHNARTFLSLPSNAIPSVPISHHVM